MNKMIWWAAVLIIGVRIFFFSAADAPKSDNTSLSVSEKIVDTVPSTKNLPKEEKKKIAEDINGRVRKTAHFLIFAAFGFAALGAMNASVKKGFKAAAFAAFVLCAFYAGTDEIHQNFVDGRACEFWDFLIDCGGALVGMCVFTALKTTVSKYFLKNS